MLAVEPEKCRQVRGDRGATSAQRRDHPGVPPEPLTVATALLEDDQLT